LQLGEEDRQLVLMALAVMSLRCPGLAMPLSAIACRIDNQKHEGWAEMYEAFRLYRRDIDGEKKVKS
jgi:hypothetical protein